MRASWAVIRTIAKRELAAYFESPVAYVFLVIFLLLSGFFTFTFGGFFERGEASLAAFFNWLPWLFLFLVPAAGMRLWSEERRLGTIELLLTMPVAAWQAIVGKFLASWLFLIVALALSFPIVATVNWLGDPDNGVIASGYVGAALLAGADRHDGARPHEGQRPVGLHGCLLGHPADAHARPGRHPGAARAQVLALSARRVV